MLLSSQSKLLAQPAGQDLILKLKLTGYEVHLTKAKKPYQYRTDNNTVIKKADKAYLVLLHLEPMPKVTNTRIDFYIGDYKVPEYGSTKTGIYFRIYDAALLARLKDQPISWQYGDQPRNVFENKRFQADSKKLKIEQEETVLGKKEK
jgi:hypothetical protein